MTSSTLRSFFSQLHFSSLPAIPTTRQPLILAIWHTIEPTAPAAAETTTVSPFFGCPMSRKPKYAVGPVKPRTEIKAVSGNPVFYGSFTTSLPGAIK